MKRLMNKTTITINLCMFCVLISSAQEWNKEWPILKTYGGKYINEENKTKIGSRII